eukprot:scaffold16831_cov127-Isochrysis_galbana.AAC.6
MPPKGSDKRKEKDRPQRSFFPELKPSTKAVGEIIFVALTNDQASRERGADNAMKFKELLAVARVRVKNREGMPHEASCVHICESYLGPYEEARASLYKKGKPPVPKEAERPRVNHV